MIKASLFIKSTNKGSQDTSLQVLFKINVIVSNIKDVISKVMCRYNCNVLHVCIPDL